MTVLYVVVCAAGPARDIGILIDQAKDRDWTTCVIATPAAYKWLDIPALVEHTGYPVRVEHRMPGEPDVLPKLDAIVVAPATFNTINKMANGITDNLALGLLNENIGLGTHIVVAPFLNSAYAAHPALLPNVERLRGAGVTVLLDPEELHPPGQGDSSAFPWTLPLDALDQRTGR